MPNGLTPVPPEGWLLPEATIKRLLIVQTEGACRVAQPREQRAEAANLDAAIAQNLASLGFGDGRKEL